MMILRKLLLNKVTLFCSLFILFISILLKYYGLNTIDKNMNLIFSSKLEKKNDKLFTQEELIQFNGIDMKQMYLAILGNVFDVTKGKKHYGKGSGYNFFIGMLFFSLVYF